MATAIEVQDVSKRFRVYREKPTSLKQRLLSGRTRAEDFWALRDVSFEVPQGGTLALIGHNGSGKSTMLKVIAGILRPTKGLIRERGRIAGLLELGAGFHPELTGRENVYLNSSFLGLSRTETDGVYDDIVQFAELEDFMDTAVKFYSSGMLVRLGFACAVHVDPEIVLIDEVLAVGDEAFQARCLDKVRSFQREGRSIVIVSHALDLVRQLCDQAVMLDHGRVHAIGSPDDVVREMRLMILHHDLEFAREEGSKEVEIVQVELLRDGAALTGPVRSGETLTVQIDLRAAEPVVDPVVSFALHDATNSYVFGDDTGRLGLDLGTVEGTRRDPVRPRPDPRHRRQVLDHPRRALARQRARLPRAGRALLVRGAAGGGTPRPTLDPRDGPDGGPVSDTTTTPTQKGDRRMTIGLILVSVTLAAIAQVTLKIGMNHVTDANGGQLALTGDGLKQIASTLLVWVGLGDLRDLGRDCGCSRCRAPRCRSPIRSRRSAT